MNENNMVRNGAAIKWLQMWFYIALVSVINSVITVIPAVPATLTAWISRGIMAAMIFCAYKLSSVGERYKKAAVYRAVMLGCTLAVVFLLKSSVLNLAASIFSIMAVYQEYSAHAELIEEQDPKLAGKWHGLFYWGLVAGVLIFFGTMIVAVVASAAEMDIATAAAAIVALLSIPQLIIEVIYLWYLARTIKILNASGGNDYDL